MLIAASDTSHPIPAPAARPTGLRWWGLLVAAFAIQVAVKRFPEAASSEGLSTLFYHLSHGLLLVALARNFHLWGARLLLLGLVLNLLAMGFNGWRMPISPEALLQAGFTNEAALPSGTYLGASKTVLLERAETNLWPLTDIFAYRGPGPLQKVFSIGDLIIGAGVVVLAVQLVLRRMQSPEEQRFCPSPEAASDVA